jgi:predicted  nucleic acid-binding Zn-ribbon protein
MDQSHFMPSQWEAELARLREENQSLRAQLEDSQETLRAIREGAVDALAIDRRAEEQIQRQMEELRVSNEELARFNAAMVDREMRMVELKKEVNALYARLGEPGRYPLDFTEDQP